MFGIVSLVVAVVLLCWQCDCDRDVQTIPTDDTKATYIGTVSVTEFATKEYVTAKFLGIPFAHPPVRFAKPVLDTPKEGFFRATKFGNVCPQDEASTGVCDQNMSEDCLYLNIYAPLKSHDLGVPEGELASINSATISASSVSGLSSTTPAATETTNPDPRTSSKTRVNTRYPALLTAHQNDDRVLLSPDTKYAVLIYMHGGAYVYGNGNCYGGSVLAGFGNIIVVTINYRLGNFGFLSTHDDVIPGNLGLWDQHVAIQWVNKHIHVFGGDRDRITVGGQSSGSYSTIYQSLYKGNEKLFQRILAQSGTPIAAKSVTMNGYNTTLEVATRAKCNITGTKHDIKTCLMSKSVRDLVSIHLPIIVPGSLSIQPTVDSPLITEDPYVMMSQMVTPHTSSNKYTVPPHFISKDILIGTNSQDGDIVYGLYAMMVTRDSVKLLGELLTSPIYADRFKEVVRNYFKTDYKDIVDERIIKAVIERYRDWENPNDQYAQSYRAIDMFTDVMFALPSLDTAFAHINSQEHKGSSCKSSVNISEHDKTTRPSGCQDGVNRQGRTFVYRFTLPKPARSSFLHWMKGTGHGSEVYYVFGHFENKKLADEIDINLAKNVMTYWSNFVKSGDPNNNSQPGSSTEDPKFRPPVWKEYSRLDEQFLELSTNPVSKSRMQANQRHYWTTFIPELRYSLQAVWRNRRKR